MDPKQQLLNLPCALEDLLGRKRAEYEDLIHRTRWGAGPLCVLARGDSMPNAATAQLAFESLLGWPVLTRHPALFLEYAMPLLRPGLVLLVLAPERRSPQLRQIIRAAEGQRLPVLTLPALRNPAATDGSAASRPVRANEESEVRSPILEQAAICYFATLAARLLKPPQRQIEACREELERLPRHVDWVLTQAGAAIRSLAAEIRLHRELAVVGSGFYYPTALHAQRVFSRRPDARATAVSPPEGFAPGAEPPVCLVLSGSRCRARQSVERFLAQMREKRTRVLAITDGSDRAVREASEIALLLPPLSEMAGSILAHVVVRWLDCELHRTRHEAGRTAPPG
jgi:fructoselysine-6-P-deglycase FrlB-like protein